MTISEKVRAVLCKKDGLVDESGNINFAELNALVEKTDFSLIRLLLKDKEIKDKFFAEEDRVLIFKAYDFKIFLEQEELNNSRTRYKNRIGLSAQSRFLSESVDVVLDFPFKDCILSGGQESEKDEDICYTKAKDGQGYSKEKAKRKEIFFNQVLADAEIDRLLDPKALVGWKRYSPNNPQGGGGVKRISPSDNLIMKGNNLIALHCLHSAYAGKVKLIYIDPPYNTGNDGFKYNDSFNHSSWLVFMKNRLEASKPLLRNDGLVFVQCDDNEQAYLKVLMDEIYGRGSYLGTIAWNQLHTRRNDARNFSKNHEYCLVYANRTADIRLIKNEPYDKSDNYKCNDNDGRGDYKLDPLTARSGRDREPREFANGVKWGPPPGRYWNCAVETLRDWEKDNRIKFNSRGTPMKKSYLAEVQEGRKAATFWPGNEYGYNINGDKEIKNLLGSKAFTNPKPESYIKTIIEIATEKTDIVLDYHLGSGTTAAVAHKMGRQYIGIEQMDYIESIAVERLKKVVAGEQGGVSKCVEWSGGGEFIYCELAQWNAEAIQLIGKCGTSAQLRALFQKINQKYFLDYNVNVKNFLENISKEQDFKELAIEKQKDIYASMLDLNQLYVNMSEMNDKRFDLGKEDRDNTIAFYSLGNL